MKSKLEAISVPKLIKIGSEIDPKMISTSKLVLESIFFRFFIAFGPTWDQFWSQNGRKTVPRRSPKTGGIPKIDRKSIQTRCLHSASSFHCFFIQNFMFHPTLEPVKSLKTNWFFDILACSTYYRLL